MLGAAAAKLKKKMQAQNWKHLEAGRTALLQPLTVISKPLVLRPVRPNQFSLKRFDREKSVNMNEAESVRTYHMAGARL